MSSQSSKNISKFPYEVFPTEIQILVESALETLSFPIEYLGSSILSAVSVAIGNTYKAKLKDSHISIGSLYMVLIGRAGDMKSHPLSFAFAPTEKREELSYDNYKNEKIDYDNLTEDQKKTVPKPRWKKQILKDFTPESLVKIHSNNTRGVVILSDELLSWIKNFGRYNSSSEQESYLSFWNGNSISIDRKSDEPIRLKSTYVNIIGSIQTKLLYELSKNDRGENGFLYRFLFALNENPKPVLWNNKILDKRLIIEYEKLINRLYSLDFDNLSSNIIEFTPEAQKLIMNYQNKCRVLHFEDEIENAIQSKYETYTIRFSLIIQLMHWALNEKTSRAIELFAVEKAIKLTEYYFNNALIVHNKIYNTNPLENLTTIQKELYNNLESKFNTQQAINEAKNLGIAESTLYRFLKNKTLFSKPKYGTYEKIHT